MSSNNQNFITYFADLCTYINPNVFNDVKTQRKGFTSPLLTLATFTSRETPSNVVRLRKEVGKLAGVPLCCLLSSVLFTCT